MNVKFLSGKNIDEKKIVNIPANLLPKGGEEGIDLTGYPVVYMQGGRRVPDMAKALHGKINSIVVYSYDWQWGYGDGVLLPSDFDPSNLSFYKTEKQLKAELRARLQEVRVRLHAEFSDIRVTHTCGGEHLEIGPNQEATSRTWDVTATSYEEAISDVAKQRPLWKEWNQRVLEIYAARGLTARKGSVEILFKGSSDALIQIEKDQKKFWIHLKLVDGTWTEVGEIENPSFEREYNAALSLV